VYSSSYIGPNEHNDQINQFPSNLTVLLIFLFGERGDRPIVVSITFFQVKKAKAIFA
jgi:hypothetical protein